MRPVGTGNRVDPLKRGAALAVAVDLCRQRGVQLTATRRTLLEILWERPRHPLGAYPLVRRLETSRGRPVTVTSVYRALDFLLHQGFVMRVEARNGYLPCPDPGLPFEGAIFICETSGSATGVNDPAIERLPATRAESFEFAVRGTLLELQGVCRQCSKGAWRIPRT